MSFISNDLFIYSALEPIDPTAFKNIMNEGSVQLNHINNQQKGIYLLE